MLIFIVLRRIKCLKIIKNNKYSIVFIIEAQFYSVNADSAFKIFCSCLFLCFFNLTTYFVLLWPFINQNVKLFQETSALTFVFCSVYTVYTI